MKIYDVNEAVIVKDEREVQTLRQVIQQSYFLLSLTVLFSALIAFLTMFGYLPLIANGFGGFILMFGSLWLAQIFSSSKLGLMLTFIFTGLAGNSLAPLLAYYLSSFSNGYGLVMGALLGTGGVFIGLSSYVWITKKDFSFLYGILIAGLMSVLVLSVLGLFLNLSFLEGAISAAMVVISSGLILFRTSVMIRGEIRDPVLITIGLYVSIFNLFVYMLNILSIFSGRNK